MTSLKIEDSEVWASPNRVGQSSSEVGEAPGVAGVNRVGQSPSKILVSLLPKLLPEIVSSIIQPYLEGDNFICKTEHRNVFDYNTDYNIGRYGLFYLQNFIKDPNTFIQGVREYVKTCYNKENVMEELLPIATSIFEQTITTIKSQPLSDLLQELCRYNKTETVYRLLSTYPKKNAIWYHAMYGAIESTNRDLELIKYILEYRENQYKYPVLDYCLYYIGKVPSSQPELDLDLIKLLQKHGLRINT